MTSAINKSQRQLSLPKLVFLAGMMSSCILAAATGFLIKQEYTQAERKVGEDLERRAGIVSVQTAQMLASAQLVLESLVEDVRRAGAQTPEDYRQALGDRAAFDRLVARARPVPQVDVVTIVATNGDVINFNRSYPPPPINLSDRDYFKAHFQGEGIALFISSPVKNRGTGAWTFYLSRAIRSSSGEIIGLVLTGLSVDYFVETFRAVSVSRDGSENEAISLFRSDGILLARYPWREDAIGKSFAEQAAFRILAEDPVGHTALTSDSRLADPATSVERFVSPKPVRNVPAVVNITWLRDEALKDWREGTRNVIFVVGPALLVSVIFTIFTFMVLRQRERLVQEITAAKAEAERASESKSVFVRSMSHELRTPLNGILGMLKLLRLKQPSREQVQYIGNAEQSARHLLGVVNDILDLSKLEAGFVTIEPSEFSLRNLLEQVISIQGPFAAQQHNLLEWTVADDVPDILVSDEGRLRQIIYNLVSNANKFTENGSVRIEARASGVTESGLTLEIEVQDTGIGISPEAMSRLFKDFSQADQSISRRFGGTGLGLSICRRLVELLGGEIGVRQRTPAGSIFWFRTPCHIGKQAPRPASVDGLPEPHTVIPARVLVAEDNAINQQVIGNLLRHFGFTCDIVSNGFDALIALKREEYDIVLMDVQMPELDGVETTRAIRKSVGPERSIPVIMLTAHAMTGDRENYLSVGATDYVSKPIDEHLLFNAIQRALGRDFAQVVPAGQKPVAPEPAEAPQVSDEGESAMRDLLGRLGNNGPASNTK